MYRRADQPVQRVPSALDDQVVQQDTGSIGRARVDGSGVNQDLITGLGQPAGLAVSGGYLYWSDNGRDSIGRARADGSQVNASFIIGTAGPTGIAVYGGFIYWAAGTGSTGVIERASVNGSAINPALVTGTRSAGEVAAG